MNNKLKMNFIIINNKIKMKFSLIAACLDHNMGIGYEGKLQWHIPEDLQYFYETTVEHIVVMGNNTWKSIPDEYKPLRDRFNIILSHNLEDKTSILHRNILFVNNFDSLFNAVQMIQNTYDKYKNKEIFIIGGEQIYKKAMNYSECNKIYLTRIYDLKVDCDTFFPNITKEWNLDYISDKKLINDTSGYYKFLIYSRECNSEEQQYMDLITDIIENGIEKSDRTGVGTISRFGAQMRFSLRNNSLPLLTTKKIFWRAVVEELLWFISGSTDANILKDKNIKIWNGNTSRDFLDKNGLENYEEGDCGPFYGFQWRHFGATYKGKREKYDGEGFDQLQHCIEQIKNNPNSRRIILTAWNPPFISQMVLPPCHTFCQFYVNNNELSCQMYQRSADMGLGVPFNIASYSLLTIMIAHVCNLKCGEFIHTIGDAHVYVNHVEPLKKQLRRYPKNFPTLSINRKVDNIDDFVYDDFAVHDYNPYPKIKMEMAV